MPFDLWHSGLCGEVHHLADVQLHPEIDGDDVLAFDEGVAERHFLIRERVAVIVRRYVSLPKVKVFFSSLIMRRRGKLRDAES